MDRFKFHIAHKNSGGNILAALTLSGLNQVVSSGSNFLLGLYLVRTLSSMEFGFFGIGFALALFYVGIGNACFLIQMVVHTPSILPHDRRAFATRIFVLITIFSVTTLIVAAFLFLASQTFFTEAKDVARFGLAVAFAAVSILLKEFFVRHAYNVQRESWALIVDSVVGMSLLLMLLYVHGNHVQLTAAGAFLIYGIAHIGGAISGYLFVGLTLQGTTRAALLRDVKMIWRGARWAGMTSTMEFIRAQSNVFITAALLGPVSVAKMNAARLLITPALLLAPPISLIAMPRLALRGIEHPRKTILAGLGVGGALFAIALLYSSLLLVWHDGASSLVLNDRYSDLFVITVLWSLYACIFSFKVGVEISFQVLRQFKLLTLMKAISALASLAATWVLTVKYGLPGALIGLIAGELILLTLLVVGSRKIETQPT